MRNAAARSFSWSVLAIMSAMRRDILACFVTWVAACSRAYPTASAAAATRSTPSSSNGRVRRLSASSATEPVRTRGPGSGFPREPCTHHRRSVAASRLACVSSSCRSLAGYRTPTTPRASGKAAKRSSNWLSRRLTDSSHLHSKITRSPLLKSARTSGIPSRLRRSALAEIPRLRSSWARWTLTPSSRIVSDVFCRVVIAIPGR